MPNNWKTYKVKELTNKIGSGATPRGGKEAYLESGISLIRSQNVLDFSFSTEGLAFIDETQAKALNNVTIESRDVLLNITGDSVARVCQVPDKWLPARVNQHVAIIRANQKLLSPEFLLYTLLTKSNKNTLLTMASAGATRNALTKQMIEDFEISIPPLPEQRAIASILSALDDKIELNLQMNKTLEEMAMTLYKHWFVDFGPFQNGEFVDSELGMIPKGWELKTLNQLGKIFYGKMPKNENILENGYPLYSGYRYVGFYSDFNCEKGKVIVVARGVGGTGDVKLTSEKCFLTNLSICIGNDLNIIDDLILFFGLKRNGLDYLRTGSAQPQITINDLNTVSVLVPKREIQIKFLHIFRPLIEEMESNSLENQIHTTLRDTLLPKLISGEVRVKEAEKILTETL
jgi:type I restriction enzyme S subunit